MIKVTLNEYRFNINDETEKNEYNKLCEEIKRLGHTKFDCIEHSSKTKIKSGEYTIDPEGCLFNNQYNTEDGHRIFDWKEPIFPNRSIKSGYYLTGELEELKKAKENQYACGYCGARS